MKRTLAALKSMNRTLLGLLITWATLVAMWVVSGGHVPLWLVLLVSLAIGLLMPIGPEKDEEEQP